MSDYRRWISYIYAYENGVKKRSAGYAKLELKDGKLAMTLHVTPDGREGSLKVCMYKCHAGSREGVLLGSVEKKQGGEGTHFEENAADLRGSGLLFQEMNGLLLYDEKGKYLISSWEDEPVEIKALQEIVAQLEQTKKKAETFTEKKETADAAQAGQAKDRAGGEDTKNAAKEKKETDAQAGESIKNPDSDEAAEAVAEEKYTDKQMEEERKTENRTWKNRLEENKKARESWEKEEEQVRELQPAPTKQETAQAGITSYFAPASSAETETKTQELHTSNETRGPVQAQSSDTADIPAAEEKQPLQPEDNFPEKEINAVLAPGRLESRIFSCLPAMYPFEHQEFERSVRMEPQDIGLLPREMWKYAGNSFLLHSYYAYHHILFVRKVRKDQRNCYLMLPGVYNPKEQHMAQLFGFSRFCPVRKKALQQGDFGYWYMEIEFPD